MFVSDIAVVVSVLEAVTAPAVRPVVVVCGFLYVVLRVAVAVAETVVSASETVRGMLCSVVVWVSVEDSV